MPRLTFILREPTVNCELQSVDTARKGCRAKGRNEGSAEARGPDFPPRDKKQGHDDVRARVRRYVNGIPIFPVNASTFRYLEALRQSRNCTERASRRGDSAYMFFVTD